MAMVVILGVFAMRTTASSGSGCQPSLVHLSSVLHTVSGLCKELGISPVTLYRHADPQGSLRDHGKPAIGSWIPFGTQP